MAHSKSITLVAAPTGMKESNKNVLSDKEKVQAIKGEVVSALEDRIEDLRRKAQVMHGTMEQLMFRVDAQGFDLKLDDLKTGQVYKTMTEIKILQDIREYIESLD